MSVLLGPAQVGGGEQTNTFGEANSVAGEAVDAVIVSFTVPVGKTLLLDLVGFSGDTTGRYNIEIGGIRQDQGIAYWSGDLRGVFLFGGFKVAASVKVELLVDNIRDDISNFTGKILGRLK